MPRALPLWAVSGLLMSAALPVQANVMVSVDGTDIYDNLAGDTNAAVDIIDFAIISTNFSGYQVAGTVQLSPPWAVGPSLSGQASAAVTLTNFTATAVPGSTVGGNLAVRFRGEFTGTYAAGVAFDTLSAEVGNALNNPVLANTDTIIAWESWMFDNTNNVQILPSSGLTPLGNPAHPGPGTTPYTVISNGPVATPTFVNPTLEGYFLVTLGALNDQFILPSSAEVGYAVPEPMSMGWALLAVAGAGCRRRSA